MNREHGRREGDGPKAAGHSQQDEKQDDCRGRMQQNVAQMVSPHGLRP